MKKLFISVLILGASFNTVEAKNTNVNTLKKEVSVKISPFFKLIKQGNYVAVKAMIESGENVNKKSNGLTPLMFAARYNQAKVAELLIKKGANLKAKSDRGNYTALKWAEITKAKETLVVIKNALQK